MLIKMTLFRKRIQTFYKKLYNFLFCVKKKSSIQKNEYCSNCREYLLNQSDDHSSISDLDYNKIYINCDKLDNF
jgi:hypothetical protein